MAKSKKSIFAHENKYKRNIFQRIRGWFCNLKSWQKALTIGLTLILVLVLAVGGVILSKLSMMNRVDLGDRDLSCVDVDGYVNILLLGVDTRDMNHVEGAGADAIMILSLKEETGEVKLMSVYRDTYMKMGDEDYYDKITNANRIGGPALMMQSLNQAMDLNISKFVVVNFKAVADLVDAVGGVEVTVEDYEIEQLNKYTKQTANNIGKENYKLVEAPGKQTLEGVQAVAYGRIRKGVGDDYKRTERMRTVLSLVFQKMKTMSISELNDLLNQMLPQVQTNLSNKDMLTMAARLVSFKIEGSAGWPYDLTSGMVDSVSYVFPNTLEKNVIELHEKMFGQTDYQPTDTVLTMNDRIISDLSGSKNRKDLDTRSEDDKKKDQVKDDRDKDKDKDKDKRKDQVKDDEETSKESDQDDAETLNPEKKPGENGDTEETPQPEDDEGTEDSPEGGGTTEDGTTPPLSPDEGTETVNR